MNQIENQIKIVANLRREVRKAVNRVTRNNTPENLKALQDAHTKLDIAYKEYKNNEWGKHNDGY